MNTNLSFEEKVMVLSTIRSLGLKTAVLILSNMKRWSTVVAREVLDKIEAKNYLVEYGIVEKSDVGVVRFVSFKHPQQPDVITSEYMTRFKGEDLNDFYSAFAALNCSHLVKSIKPASIVARKMVA